MLYEEMSELKDVVELLKKTKSFKEKLEHINSERILYSSFSKKQSRAKGKIGPIPARVAIFLKDHEYFLEVHKESWITASEGERLYIILHELYHIPIDGFNKESAEYKKVNLHDLEDFKILVNTFGVDLENADKLVKIVENEE